MPKYINSSTVLMYFPFSSTLYLYSSTFQRQILYFLLHLSDSWSHFSVEDFTLKTYDEIIKFNTLLKIKPNVFSL